jgi:hypothetical protein
MKMKRPYRSGTKNSRRLARDPIVESLPMPKFGERFPIHCDSTTPSSRKLKPSPSLHSRILTDSHTSKTTMKIVLPFLLLAVASATYFELDSSPTCPNSGLVLDVAMTCSSSGKTACNFGDTATVTGYLSVPSSGMSDYVTLKNKACFMGVQSSYTCENHNEDVSLCSLFNLGQYGCPAAGNYTLDGTFTVPTYNGTMDLGSFWWSKYLAGHRKVLFACT